MDSKRKLLFFMLAMRVHTLASTLQCETYCQDVQLLQLTSWLISSITCMPTFPVEQENKEETLFAVETRGEGPLVWVVFLL